MRPWIRRPTKHTIDALAVTVEFYAPVREFDYSVRVRTTPMPLGVEEHGVANGANYKPDWIYPEMTDFESL